MREEFVLINVRPNGEAAKDIVVRDGRFAEIFAHGARAFEAMRVVDGEGLLMLPGLVDAHTHLDKTLLGMPWYRNDVGLELIDLIEIPFLQQFCKIQPKRPMAKGAGSAKGASPVIISARSRPVAGPSVSPW